MRYDDVANLPFGKERFERGSFQFDDVILNSMHQREVPLARTGGGGLELQDSPSFLSMRAVLPDTAAARDTSDPSALWRSQGAVCGVSGPRGTCKRVICASSSGLHLSGLGIVDIPAYIFRQCCTGKDGSAADWQAPD